jgi:hypothetical protein
VWIYKHQGQLYLIFKQILKSSPLAWWVYGSEGLDLICSILIMTQCISEWENNFQSQRKSSRLLPSNSTPVLQYGSGSSSDFLAKILGVHTLLFLCNTQLCFSLSLPLLCMSSKRIFLSVHCRSSVDSMCAYSVSDPCSVLKYAFFFNHQVCNGCGGCKMSFIFQVFAFIYILFSFIHIWEWEECSWFPNFVSSILSSSDTMMLGILKFKVCLPLH